MQEKVNFIEFHKPSFDDNEINAVVDTLKSGWITTGPRSIKLEEDFKHHLGTNKNCLALNSCTAALHLSLCLLNISAGDEVITTPFTFIATTNVIEHTGARVVLADIEKETLNISHIEIEKQITARTKAIIVVHYGGRACNMGEIMKISEKYNIPVIEDVAHGIGGQYKGQALGTFGRFAAFSFYANKNITTIEGGMLVGDEEDIKKARIMSLHGISRDAWKRYKREGSWLYDVVYPGLKYNMTDVSAAIGIVQLSKLDNFYKKRQKIISLYNIELRDSVHLETPIESDSMKHAWYNYPVRLNLGTLNITRDEVIQELKDKMIGTSVHFIPVHLHSYYKEKYGFKPTDFPVSYNEYLRIICLPLYPDITHEEVIYISRQLRSTLVKFLK